MTEENTPQQDAGSDSQPSNEPTDLSRIEEARVEPFAKARIENTSPEIRALLDERLPLHGMASTEPVTGQSLDSPVQPEPSQGSTPVQDSSSEGNS
jgi:hypothetical protein